jgi:PIN domain nuclease of toxin-antitoxin system
VRRFLLDTHVFVWLVESPGELSHEIIRTLGDMENEVMVSAASFWEIAMNRNRGRMKFSQDVATSLRAMHFIELPVTGAHYEAAVALPEIHKDPFDRLLVAQALSEGMVLVTRDKLLAAYNVPMVRV